MHCDIHTCFDIFFQLPTHIESDEKKDLGHDNVAYDDNSEEKKDEEKPVKKPLFSVGQGQR